jgi:hypothetical protein
MVGAFEGAFRLAIKLSLGYGTRKSGATQDVINKQQQQDPPSGDAEVHA